MGRIGKARLKRKRPSARGERPKSREETPKEGSSNRNCHYQVSIGKIG
jgi:hypothetical protein